MQRFKSEINILKKLDHPNILKLYEYFKDEKYVYLITELCTGGELFDYVERKQSLSEKDACRIFR